MHIEIPTDGELAEGGRALPVPPVHAVDAYTSIRHVMVAHG